jgi:hypothetical protein
MKNSGEGVYPMIYTAAQSNQACCIKHGITKLEHFAGLAMQGYLASGNAGNYTALIAGWSVATAKDLLAELENES